VYYHPFICACVCIHVCYCVRVWNFLFVGVELYCGRVCGLVFFYCAFSYVSVRGFILIRGCIKVSGVSVRFFKVCVFVGGNYRGWYVMV
jgi:hypothetical protein